jgi:hypothetical protein
MSCSSCLERSFSLEVVSTAVGDADEETAGVGLG